MLNIFIHLKSKLDNYKSISKIPYSERVRVFFYTYNLITQIKKKRNICWM